MIFHLIFSAISQQVKKPFFLTVQPVIVTSNSPFVFPTFRMRERELARQQAAIASGAMMAGGGGPSNFYQCKSHQYMYCVSGCV